ncbi:MAG: DNA mismatch repair endonuclease MutL, partial [Acholeplasmataceae bacterium]|nr:DNA mismatch repair endonuclease MutL [Acholeplasmataceae bacterium]
MTKILKMDERLANMIAAGEVVERPSSIVKELVENAIDADANVIRIEIFDVGMTKIQVTDNGSGMNLEDALLAFERHATSKIKTEYDLSRIHTLGFRGEALAAIQAVAKVTLKTKT